jgi:hypothetical protein
MKTSNKLEVYRNVILFLIRNKMYNAFAKKYVTALTKKTNPHYLFENRNLAYEISKYLSLIEASINYKEYLSLEYILFAFLGGDVNKNFSTEDINFLQESLSSFFGKNNFNTNIIHFYNNFQEINQHYFSIGERISDIEKIFSTYPKIPYSIIDIEKEYNFTVKYRKKKENRNLMKKDALYIYNDLKTSSLIHAIIFTNNEGKKYYRLNTSKILKKYEILKVTYPPNSVTLIIDEQSATIDTNSSSCYITFYTKKTLSSNWISTYFPYAKYFPYLEFTETVTETRMIGNISFDTPKQLDGNLFYRELISHPLFSFFFYVDESTNIWASRELSYTVGFRNYNSSMILKTSKVINSMTELNMSYSEKPDVSVIIPVEKFENHNDLSFHFTASSKEEMIMFAEKFSRMLGYLLKKDIILNPVTSSQYIGGSKHSIYIKTSTQLSSHRSSLFSHVRKSKNQDTIISTGKYYFTKCQSGFQPIIIEKDEIEEWRAYGKTVTEFTLPNSSEILYFLCPTEKNPILYYIENEQNVDPVLYQLPCCGKGKIKNIEGSMSESQTRSNKKTHLNISDKVLILKSIGTLSDPIFENFCNNAFTQDLSNKVSFIRYGTASSEENPNSILQCLYFGKYRKDITIIEIQKYRKKLSELPVDVYRQEVYDWSNEKIIASLEDSEFFLDPYLFYRGLEILFEVSIYIFSKSSSSTANILDHPISVDQQLSLNITYEIPRGRYFHQRHFSKNPVACIYKNHGTNKVLNFYPTYELIICQPNIYSNEYTMLYENPYFIKAFYDLSVSSSYTYLWESPNFYHSSVVGYDSPFGTNWESLFGSLSVGQIRKQEIDAYGKTVKLFFDRWTLGIPPTQPLYLPESEKYLIPSLPSRCDVYQNFDLSSSIDDVDGFWIPYQGNPQGIKIYCHMEDIASTLIKSSSEITQFIDLKNRASILMQIINWLWKCDVIILNISFREWFEDHTVIDNSDIFKFIPAPIVSCNNIIFPQASTFSKRLLFMTQWWPFFFYHNKIHLSSNLYHRILNYFEHEEILSVTLKKDDYRFVPKESITDLYPTENDFSRYDDIIFDTFESVEEYILSYNQNIFPKISLKNFNIIYTQIYKKFEKNQSPYLFKDISTGKMYIIQNVSYKMFTNKYEPALRICKTWKLEKYNPGSKFGRNNITYNDEPFVVYIPSDENIQISEDYTRESSEYYEIITYSPDVQGAMLPLN